MKRYSVIRLAVLVACATALVLAVTACGSSKSSSSGSNATATTATTAETTETTTSSSSGSSSNGTDTGASTTSSGNTGVPSKSCLDFANAAGKLGQALGASGSSTSDPDAFKKYLEGIADNAPSDIKSSFQTIADAYSKYLETLKSLGLKPGSTPSADDVAKLQEAAQAISKPEVQAASKKIQAWVDAGCHS